MLSTGDIVGARYQIRTPLGPTPAYLSFRAFDREAEVEVALWLMRPELFPSPRQRDGFLGSVVDMRTLRHSNLRMLFDAGYHADTVFATVQLDSDDGRVPRPGSGRAASDTDLLHYATSVADALVFAHQAGQVHGRLVATDVVHVAGLIKVGGVGLFGDVDVTAAKKCWRSQQRFLAPEVRSQGLVEPAADVFSLAMLVAELATGKAFAESGQALAHVAVARPDLAPILESAMAVAPERRPQSPATLVDELHVVLIDDRIPTGETDALAPARPAGKRRNLGFGDEGPTLVDPSQPGDGGGFAQTEATFDESATAPGERDRSEREDQSARRGGEFGAALDEAADQAEQDDDGEPEVTAERSRRQRGDARATLDGLPIGARVRRAAAKGGLGRREEPPVEAETPPPPAPPTELPDQLPAPPPLLAATEPPIPDAAGRSDLPPHSGHPVPVGSVSVNESSSSAPPADADTPAAASAGPVFVSHKPKSEPGKSKTPLVPVLDRPEMKPRLRSLDSVDSLTRSAPPGVLGHYAPPRQGQAEMARPRRRTWLYVGIGVVAAVAVAVGSWLVVTRLMNDEAAGKPPAAPRSGSRGPAPAPVVEPASTDHRAGPCPEEMVPVHHGAGYCIDAYESPGRDRMPETGIGLEQARASCRDRGARLCTDAEWEQACRGEGDSSYPYGDTFRRGRCNVDSGSIVVAGQFPGCRSAVGAFDMSGNVAEWVEDGQIRGGSASDKSDGRCSRKQHPSGEQGFSDVGFRCCRDLVRSSAPAAPAP